MSATIRSLIEYSKIDAISIDKVQSLYVELLDAELKLSHAKYKYNRLESTAVEREQIAQDIGTARARIKLIQILIRSYL